MKHLIIVTVLSMTTLVSYSQTADTRRRIEVLGAAEAEVTPDIICVNISLKEYLIGNTKKKVAIGDLERQLQTAVLNAGIPKENFMINNISSYNWDWTDKKNTDFLAKKQYKIKLTDLTKVNQLINAVDPKGVEYSGIESYDYSKIDALKKELKVKALQNAKDKATYLVESIGEKLGNSIEIKEINDEYYPAPRFRSMAVNLMSSEAAAAPLPDIDFKKIKLKYQMNTVFEVK